MPDACPSCETEFTDLPFDYDIGGNDLFFCKACGLVWAETPLGIVIPGAA